jgi:hypothetical protein
MNSFAIQPLWESGDGKGYIQHIRKPYRVLYVWSVRLQYRNFLPAHVGRHSISASNCGSPHMSLHKPF